MADSPGWFGKLPAAGDFVGRRLPAGFLDGWDRWLRAGLQCGAQADDGRWAGQLLSFPAWRFLIRPAAAAPALWCGLLLPGVDRVGRRFPLTVACPIPPTLLQADGAAVLEDWLDALEAATLAVLSDDDIARFDQRLQDIGAPQWPVCTAPADGHGHGHSARPAQAGLTTLAWQALDARLDQVAIFWNQAALTPSNLLTAALPLEPATLLALVAAQPAEPLA